MVPFLLPFVWMLTGTTAAGVLYSVASWAGISFLVFDDWKMRKCNELGVNPDKIRQVLEPEESEKLRKMRDLGLVKDFGRKRTFEIQAGEWEVKRGVHGPWFLLDSEVEVFFDGLRHMALEEGVGEEAQNLRAIIKDTGIDYEDLSFLWEGYHIDLARLRKVSEARRAEPEWMDVVSYLMERQVSKA